MSDGEPNLARKKRAFELVAQTLLCIIDALGLGYPLRGCVSAEPRSVSPGNDEFAVHFLIEHSSCLKNLGGPGAGPRKMLARFRLAY